MKIVHLSNINELDSLVDGSRHSPALQANHPLTEVRDVNWLSTTSFFEPDWARTMFLNKGALGVGCKKRGILCPACMEWIIHLPNYITPTGGEPAACSPACPSVQ